MSNDALTERDVRALRHLRDAIVHEGYSPSIRDLAKALGYKSPRTAFLVLNRLIERGWVSRRANGNLQFRKDIPGAMDHVRTVEVPLIGNVACGVPLLAEENIEAYLPVSVGLAKPGHKYFFLRAAGDSMNAVGIQAGDLMLVRQQPQAENGEKVVALINDEATVKEFHRHGDAVVLKPRSKNPKHKTIVVTDNFIIQGVVTSVLPAKLY